MSHRTILNLIGVLKMKVIRGQEVVNFSDIKVAECFIVDNFNEIYMKTKAFECSEGYSLNAVNIDTGELYAFNDMIKVTPINCETYICG